MYDGHVCCALPCRRTRGGLVSPVKELLDTQTEPNDAHERTRADACGRVRTRADACQRVRTHANACQRVPTRVRSLFKECTYLFQRSQAADMRGGEDSTPVHREARCFRDVVVECGGLGRMDLVGDQRLGRLNAPPLAGPCRRVEIDRGLLSPISALTPPPAVVIFGAKSS